MNATKVFAITMVVSSLAALPLLSAPPVIIVQPPAPPAVIVQAPVPVPPAVTVEVGVPDNYVWDGNEYVGVIGTQYYYLGPNNIWLAMDAPRLARWHDWEKVHADWRDHAIRNELYRHDAHGHEVPLREDHSHDKSPPDKGHDNDH